MSDLDEEAGPAASPDAPVRGQVVSLTDHEPTSADRLMREMRSYWNGIRHGRAVPARSDVDPRHIARMLDYAFILERIAPGAARIRLAGRHLIDLMGMEVRGMPICAFLNGPSRGRFSDVLETVFKAPQIAQIALHGKPGYARPEISAQMLLLPLRSDFGDVTRALGCLIAEGPVGVAPRRFDMAGDQVLPILEGGAVMTPSPSTIGFAEQGAPFHRTASQAPSQAASHATARPLDQSAPPAADSPEERRARFRIVSTGPAAAE